jgi:hypothetical protein
MRNQPCEAEAQAPKQKYRGQTVKYCALSASRAARDGLRQT